MCLRAQGIDDDNGSVGRVRRDRGIRNYDGGAGRGKGIDDTSKGLEITAEIVGD